MLLRAMIVTVMRVRAILIINRAVNGKHININKPTILINYYANL